MYNINLSFIQSKELDFSTPGFENRYNELFKNKIIDSICPFLNNKIICDECLPTTKEDSNYSDPRNIIEVNCKGLIGHHFCEVKTDSKLYLGKDDLVLIQMEDCLDIAVVDEVGDIVRARRKKLCLMGEELPVISRKADESDLENFRVNLNDEIKARSIFRERVEKFELNMKLVDIHYQFDRKRLFFFYTSDGRVDFRELAKDLASIFKTRIELRQIGVRDEAKRIGGIGSCGREYCCKLFLQNFKKITTQIANDQNTTTNLSKLSGPCGKLKCCLSFELDENQN